MDKIFTYLLGAGASFKTLPLVNDFTSRLERYRTDTIYKHVFQENEFPSHYSINVTKDKIREQFVRDLDWLITEIQEHSSIDTFARKLFLTKQDDYYRTLKLLVSEFLIFEELKNGIDSRYDAFFATLLDLNENEELSLPDNVRVLSWNYDKQVEFSVGQFSNTKKSKDVEKFIQLYPRKDYTEYQKGFALFKLNGTIGGTINSKGFEPMNFELDKIKNKIDEKIKDRILSNSFKRYLEAKNYILYQQIHDESDLTYSINYSWEKEHIVLDIREQALKATLETSVLIVIGYSFPTFNRKVDSQIINNMKNLQRIYVQSPKESIAGVIQRIKALKSEVPIQGVEDVGEFYIPFEFE